ncbi:MAG: YihA family ribosome biogenesis GTP-binding protein [Alphaproteobacteria bacterium]|nr:MAG: YihA family ribosome biogenesis GTP-binding protein [Alphaproteobacteria bacterium]
MARFNLCEFTAGVNRHDALPPYSLPEVAFAGRSNVGKSSLINAVLGKRDLARTSQTPGRTRQLNFFRIDETFFVVDLPGYGFAEASKRDIKQWTQLTRDYLCGRPTLRRVFLLLDARRDKINEDDQAWMTMLDESAVTYQCVLTKVDKVTQAHHQMRIEQLQAVLRRHPAALPEIISTSSDDGTGLDVMRSTIFSVSRY